MVFVVGGFLVTQIQNYYFINNFLCPITDPLLWLYIRTQSSIRISPVSKYITITFNNFQKII